LRNEYRFGLNGGRIWYKEWFGLLAMVTNANLSNGETETCYVSK